MSLLFSLPFSFPFICSSFSLNDNIPFFHVFSSFSFLYSSLHILQLLFLSQVLAFHVEQMPTAQARGAQQLAAQRAELRLCQQVHRQGLRETVGAGGCIYLSLVQIVTVYIYTEFFLYVLIIFQN